ncbi:pentatricopeptide repeat-containing protein At4g04370 [Pistacia vera]|uniref:pentatricopeptide repeat-containing protein At4g04370 n=1 Tax=Pistacia vera TaxID=55513 RepID=UPI001263D2CC|nr:pentatricopeptide repeat-containing protein At4g04370 [Pistacia vera]
MNKLKQSLLTSHPIKLIKSLVSILSSQNAHPEVGLSNSSTFTTLLKSCISLNLFSLGLSLHQQIIVNGFSLDPYISSSLINFYAKFGHTKSARKVFDLMPLRDVVAWTAIIGCYSRAGDVNMSFCMFNEMRIDGIEPSVVTLLGMVCGVLELKHVKCLHCCVVLYGFEIDIALVNSMINMYGKCGSVYDARDLFEMMDKRDSISWNSLISGYAQVGNVREILRLLYRMRIEGVDPEQQTFGSLVSANVIENDLELGKLVHGLILRAGFNMDAHVATSLIIMYLKCGNVNVAFRIFEQTPDKDVVLWTAMISGLVQNDCADKALLIFCEMLKSRMEPSSATIGSALSACAQLGSLDFGTSIHGYIIRQEMTLDIPAQNSLVTMYAKCGQLEQSCAVFYRMGERDLVSWNAIIAGYAQNCDLPKAFFLFTEMRAALQRPDSITVVSLFQACASIGALQQGKWVHNVVIRSCLRPYILVDTALVDMYCKCGDLDAAQKCFDGMSQHDLVSWSSIIAGYGSHGRGEIALRMYEEFLHTGSEPNHVMFLAVLSACSHKGFVQQGLSIFQSMTRDFGVEPKLEHCACILDILCRAGRVEEAYDLYKGNFSDTSVDVLGILLDACRATGNWELGKIIANDVLRLKPTDAGNYVQLAHCYASLDRWDGVGEAWTLMRSLGLRKLPGWSFIELHGVITTFFMDHSSHPQFEELVFVLKTLNKEMRKMAIHSNIS